MQNIKFFMSYLESNTLQFADSYIHYQPLRDFVKQQAKQQTEFVNAAINTSIKLTKDSYDTILNK